MYTVQEVMEQALIDSQSIRVDGDGYEATISSGFKASRDNLSGQIVFKCTSRGGEWYSKLRENEIEVLLKKGWRIGVDVLSLSNISTKLDRVEELIKREMNERRNPKHIQHLKKMRDNLIIKYNYFKSKLNRNEIKNSKHQG